MARERISYSFMPRSGCLKCTLRARDRLVFAAANSDVLLMIIFRRRVEFWFEETDQDKFEEGWVWRSVWLVCCAFGLVYVSFVSLVSVLLFGAFWFCGKFEVCG